MDDISRLRARPAVEVLEEPAVVEGDLEEGSEEEAEVENPAAADPAVWEKLA